MELKSVILLLMYILSLGFFFDFIEIPVCSLSTTISEPSTVFKACSWSMESRPYISSFKFMPCSVESIIGKRNRDAELR